MRRGIAGALAALILAPLLAGCAATAPATPAAHGSSTPAPAKAAAPAKSAAPSRASVVPADSLPSEDALNVLKTIPEPLQPGEVVPPPESGAPPNATDTTGVAADSTALVPTPSPTTPLGEGPASSAQSSLADSLARMSGALAPSGPGAAGTAGGAGAVAAGAAGGAGAASAGSKPGTAVPDTCWRVQVAAPDDKDEAEAMRSAAESQLLVPMSSTFDGQRYKVQTADCLTATSSDAVRTRALSAGFDGAFRTRTVNAPPAAQPSASSKPAAAKPTSATPKKPAPKKGGK